MSLSSLFSRLRKGDTPANVPEETYLPKEKVDPAVVEKYTRSGICHYAVFPLSITRSINRPLFFCATKCDACKDIATEVRNQRRLVGSGHFLPKQKITPVPSQKPIEVLPDSWEDINVDEKPVRASNENIKIEKNYNKRLETMASLISQIRNLRQVDAYGRKYNTTVMTQVYSLVNDTAEYLSRSRLTTRKKYSKPKWAHFCSLPWVRPVLTALRKLGKIEAQNLCHVHYKVGQWKTEENQNQGMYLLIGAIALAFGAAIAPLYRATSSAEVVVNSPLAHSIAASLSTMTAVSEKALNFVDWVHKNVADILDIIYSVIVKVTGVSKEMVTQVFRGLAAAYACFVAVKVFAKPLHSALKLVFKGTKFLAEEVIDKLFGWLSNDEEPQADIEILDNDEDRTLLEIINGIFSGALGPILSFLKGAITTIRDEFPKWTRFGQAVEWLLNKGYVVYALVVRRITGAPLPITEDENTIIAYLKRVEEINAEVVKAPGTILQYRDEAFAMCDHTTNLKMNIGPSGTISQYLSSTVAECRQKLVDLKQRIERYMISAERRAVPVWIHIHGKPGFGKSHVSEALMRAIFNRCKDLGVVEDEDFSSAKVYTKPEVDNFWDNYREQFFLFFDDFMQAKDPQIRSAMATSFIYLVSTAPAPLMMADYESKGVSFFKSRVILTLGNCSLGDLTDLGLESPLAFISRCALELEITEKTNVSNTPFRIAPIYRIADEEGNQVKDLSSAQLSEVVARMVEFQSNNLEDTVVVGTAKDFKFTYTGHRFKIGEAGEPEVDIKDYTSMMSNSQRVVHASSIRNAKNAKNLAERKAVANANDRLVEMFDSDVPTKFSVKLADVQPKGEDPHPPPDGPVVKLNLRNHGVGSLRWAEHELKHGKHRPKGGSGIFKDDKGKNKEENQGKEGSRNLFEFLAREPLDIGTDRDFYFSDCKNVYWIYNGQKLKCEDGCTSVGPHPPGTCNKDQYTMVIDGETHFLTPQEYTWARALSFYAKVGGGAALVGLGAILSWWSRRLDFKQNHPLAAFAIQALGVGAILGGFVAAVHGAYSYIYPEYHPMKSHGAIRVAELEDEDSEPEVCWSMMIDAGEEGVASYVIRCPPQYKDSFEKYLTSERVKTIEEVLTTRFANEESKTRHDMLCSLQAHGFIGITGLNPKEKICMDRMFQAIEDGNEPNPWLFVEEEEQDSASYRMKLPNKKFTFRDRKGHQKNYKKANFSRFRLPKRQGTANDTEFARKIARNLVPFVVTSPERLTLASSFGLFVRGNYLIVPKHLISSHTDDVLFGVKAGDGWTYQAAGSTIMYLLGEVSDLIILHFPGVSPYKDISKYFSLGYEYDTPITRVTKQGTSNELTFHTSTRTSEYDGKSHRDLCVMDMPNWKGLCMSPYVATINGQVKIVGVHLAGLPQEQTSFVEYIDPDVLLPALSIMDEELGLIADVENRVEANIEEQCQPVFFKPPLGTTYLGTIKPPSYIPSKSKLHATGVPYPEFVPTNIKKLPARLAGEPHPMIRNHEGYVQGDTVCLRLRLDKCKDMIINKKPCRVIAAYTAIFGEPDKVDPIDFTTSAGYLWKIQGLSRAMLKTHPDVADKLIREANDILDKWKQGIVVPPVVEDTLKDELRLPEDVALGKARLFCSEDIASFIATKCLFYEFNALTKQHPWMTPCSIGIDPHSQWGLLYNRFRGKRVIFGDYSKFDRSLRYYFVNYFCSFVSPYYDEEWHNAIKACVSGFCSSIHICGDMVYRVERGTSSGNFLTGLFNSFCNVLMLSNVLYRLGEEEFELAVYGDDNLIGLRHESTVTGSQVAEQLKALFGVVYTSTDKTSSVMDFCSIDDADYLSRRFVKKETFTYAPLKPESIYNMFAYALVPNLHSKFNDVMISTMASFTLECWHYGPTYYKQAIKFCRKLAAELRVVVDFPTFADVFELRTLEQSATSSTSLNWNCAGMPHKIRIFDSEGMSKKPFPTGAQFRFTLREVQRIASITKEQTTQQMLSDDVVPSETSQVNVSFSDVGKLTEMSTHPTTLDGWNPLPDQTPVALLRRPRFIASGNWTTAQTGLIATINVWQALLDDPYYADVLRQFKYIRAGVEVTLRLNGGQMYAGALMATLCPGSYTRTRRYFQQRCVLNPGVISAATQDTVCMTLPYCAPNYFGRTDGLVFDNSVWCMIDVLSPLRANSTSVSDTISWIMTARFVDPQLSFNQEEDQSNPAVDAKNYRGPAGKPTLGDMITKTIVETGRKLITPENLASMAKLALTALDKPESIAETKNSAISLNNDINLVDRPDMSTPLAYRSDSYLGQGEHILPMQKEWTVTEYAQIPGVTARHQLRNDTQEIVIDTYGRTPLGIMSLLHRYHKGGTKIMLQFFCSAFVSARFCLRLVPTNVLVGNWENEITRMVDVNGDTTVTLTVPYISSELFETGQTPKWKLVLERVTRIVSNNVAADPGIGLVVWVAGAEDIQFSIPCDNTIISNGYTDEYVPPPPFAAEEEEQSFPGDMFKATFPPIVEGCAYMVDNHLAVSETTGLFTDILKKYQILKQGSYTVEGIITPYTFLGVNNLDAWRAKTFANCFLFHRGGIRVRAMNTAEPFPNWNTYASAAAPSSMLGNVYADLLGCISVTLPHYGKYAFFSSSHHFTDALHARYEGLVLTGAGLNQVMIAVRDDWQLGFPILPGPTADG